MRESLSKLEVSSVKLVCYHTRFTGDTSTFNRLSLIHNAKKSPFIKLSVKPEKYFSDRSDRGLRGSGSRRYSYL